MMNSPQPGSERANECGHQFAPFNIGERLSGVGSNYDPVILLSNNREGVLKPPDTLSNGQYGRGSGWRFIVF